MFMFLLTGCSVTYEVTIDGNFIDENITVLEENELIGEDLESELQFIIWMNDEVTNPMYVYSKEKVIGDTLSGLKFNNKSSYDEYLAWTPFVTSCYSKTTIEKKGDRVIFNTNGNFECFGEVDNLKLIIKSPFEIENSNADKSDNNVHIWELKLSNNKPISFELDLTSASASTSIFDNFMVVLTLVFGPIMLLIVGIYLTIKQKNKKFI